MPIKMKSISICTDRVVANFESQCLSCCAFCVPSSCQLKAYKTTPYHCHAVQLEATAQYRTIYML